ncbi:MAG: ATP-grasp domain-containing protein [Rhodothermales bacterium]|nr:ATP-grasp domain-containing protein [Rhodothermales bacterium]MBO6780488.1 ATP-grasp domain-containing protein [Rhodothermales bacterium]
MRRILVTGAGGNAARNFIASLRMAPEPFYIVGTDTNTFHLACTDSDASYVVPRCDDPGYEEALLAIVAMERVSLIHPQPDSEVGWLSEHRDHFPGLLFLPEHADVVACQDKMHCNRMLAAAGVPAPRSIRVHAHLDFEDSVRTLMGRSGKVWVRAIRGAGSRAALPVTTGEQAFNWVRYWAANRASATTDFMLSTFLPGAEFAFQSVWYDGELLTSMARERTEYLMGNLMPSGQSSSPSIARTVHRDDVNEIASAAVRAVSPKPHGIYCVDLKEDDDGTPSVTEINTGRFFTTSNFFAAAGSNMPYYYVRLAFGERVDGLEPFNACEPDLYWVRGVDRKPHLFKGAPWIQRRAA